MGDSQMKSTQRALSWTLGAFLTVFVIAMPVQARISIEALGGEIEVEGFISSEARTNVGSGSPYLSQWIQRLQIEANLQYEDVGIFDELSFTTVIRPEIDNAYYNGLSGSTHRQGDNVSYDAQRFSHNTDPIGFGGFDVTAAGFGVGNFGENSLSTGGISKLVTHGQQNPQWLNDNFETILGRTGVGGNTFSTTQAFSQANSGFPLVSATGQQELRCTRCQNLDDDPLDVAMQNTGSNGQLYPFRELYADGIIGDTWIRLGKQQIVWGKTDFFRLQDVLNPVDFGQHFFFDSFEDIRIPQWMLSVQYKAGNIGPLTDNAFQFVWNFDEFKGIGLGNPSQAWAHPFAKQQSTFAIFNHYFSTEPCIGAGYTPGANSLAAAVGGGVAGVNAALNANPNARCGALGPQDQRLPSGFGQPVGLSYSDRPDWDIKNTEPAARWEFRFKAVRMAFTHHFGWNDVPVFAFHSVNVNNADLVGTAVPGLASRTNPRYQSDNLIFDLAANLATGGSLTTAGAVGAIPITVMSPTDAINAIAGGTGPNAAQAQLAIANNNAELFYRGGALLGGQTHIDYKASHTTGMAIDYFEPRSGVVFRIESSITLDELVNNTRKATWVDESDVMRWSIGIDRPTFIPWLNKDRTFFLSMQIFDTWYIDHEGDKNTGYFVDEHNFITTFFFVGNYMRDTLKPVGFLVWEEMANSWTAGLNLEWLIDNHWSIKGGLHTIMGGDNNYTHDSGPFTSFIAGGGDGGRVTGAGGAYPYQNSVFGVAREGIGALRDNDELFLNLKYQF
ncbi:MAG: hypothetical protein ACI915_003941 [Gammaproteobacteria bacterium]|jgi:hypothetical protein